MAKPISQFFADLGFTLRNVRWSWGARNGDALLLRTWTDEYRNKERKVTVLREPEALELSESFGLDERVVQLKALWQGGLAGYAIVAEVVDKNASPRKIKSYREDVVYPVKGLEQRPDGSIAAELGEPIAVGKLNGHSQTHRTAAGAGPFPVDESLRSGLSTDTYQQKIPAIRAWLIEVCQRRGTVFYSDVMNRFGLTFYPLRNAMSRLGHDCRNAGEPIITALIVDKESGRCSQGLFDEFHIDDDGLERERCYECWASAGSASEPTPAPAPTAPVDEFENRVNRFAQVEVRTQQGAFRVAVFRACGGKCVVSGCSVPEAVEAAHLVGRDWRQGHNSVSDGILLRRDLHSLYDRGLLQIGEDGTVTLDVLVRSYYSEFDRTVAQLPFR
jgi:hypothetical protein